MFNFDEKTQVQALDRIQSSLPLRPGRACTLTHDHKRNGTVNLFAALNVATGEVLHQTRRRHTGRDVLAFFDTWAQNRTDNRQPFPWTPDADDLIARVKRGRAARTKAATDH